MGFALNQTQDKMVEERIRRKEKDNSANSATEKENISKRRERILEFIFIPAIKKNRGNWIRTSDLRVPNTAL